MNQLVPGSLARSCLWIADDATGQTESCSCGNGLSGHHPSTSLPGSLSIQVLLAQRRKRNLSSVPISWLFLVREVGQVSHSAQFFPFNGHSIVLPNFGASPRSVLSDHSFPHVGRKISLLRTRRELSGGRVRGYAVTPDCLRRTRRPHSLSQLRSMRRPTY